MHSRLLKYITALGIADWRHERRIALLGVCDFGVITQLAHGLPLDATYLVFKYGDLHICIKAASSCGMPCLKHYSNTCTSMCRLHLTITCHFRLVSALR